MPDVITSGWFPVLTLLIGFATKSLSDWIDNRRNIKREREARREIRHDQLFERRNSFQRQTLLDLQEACSQLARSSAAIFWQDKISYRSTGKWGENLLSEELNEGGRLAQARTHMLGARVRDDATRRLAEKFTQTAADTTLSANLEDGERAIAQMTAIYTKLNQRIGEVLRKLDDADKDELSTK